MLMTLDDLLEQQAAVIKEIFAEDYESIRLRSMGLVPGVKVLVLRRKPTMLHCRVNTTEFAMRSCTAKKIIL
jgi:Fe2+ transport system protein FeoA